MRQFFIIVMILICLLSLYAHNTVPDNELSKIPFYRIEYKQCHGKIKSIKQDEIFYDSDGTVFGNEKNDFLYDADGNLVKLVSPDEIVVYQYTSDYKLQKIIDYNENEEVFSTSDIIHDKKGRMVKETVYDSSNKVITEYKFTYDFKGRRLETEIHKGDSVRINRLSYDFKGNRFCTEYIFDGTIESKTFFFYDDKRVQHKKKLKHELHQNYAIHIFATDKKSGNGYSETYKDGQLIDENLSKSHYDVHGHITKFESLSPNGTLTGYIEYLYDDYFNCIRENSYIYRGTDTATLSYSKITEYEYYE